MEEHFATLKLLDSDTDCKLTRAFSYSELPSSHRVCMTQSYSGNPSGLIRQYSCEQIFDHTGNTRKVKVSEVVRTVNNERNEEWQTMVPYSNTFKIPDWPLYKTSNIIQASKLVQNVKSNEVEYMEIDNADCVKESTVLSNCLSTNTNIIDKNREMPCPESKNSVEIQTEKDQNDTTKEKTKNTYEDVKKKLRPLVPKTKGPSRKGIHKCCCNLICLCIFPVILGIIALISSPVAISVCNRSTLFLNASLEIQQKVYGQTNAISNINYALLEEMYYLKVICLIGGTGVGKSYTVEIIKQNFPNPEKIIIYDLSYNDSIDKSVLSSLNSYDLLIIENLKTKNLDIFASILNQLSKNKGKCITVFAIFNIKDSDDSLEREVNLINSKNAIINTFTTREIDMSVVHFAPLSEQALEMCITDVARNGDLNLTQNQINIIKRNLLLSGSGCKGAYAKVQVVGRE